MLERLQIVDEDDQPIGGGTRDEAWANGWILRSVFMVLRGEAGNFLLQQRSMRKKTAPGLWTFAAGGHVDENESYAAAAAREMYEEIGIKASLQKIGKHELLFNDSRFEKHYFTTVYTATISQNTTITIDPEEVETTAWFSPSQLDHDIATQPEIFSPKMRIIYQRIFA